MEQSSPAPKRKVNIAGSIGGVVGFFVVYLLVQHFFFKKPGYDQMMMQAASELNKSCPMMVDSETRFDNCAAMPNNVFRYNYTLVNFVKDSLDITMLEGNLRPTVINSVKTNPSMKVQREHNTTMSYYYSDKNGVFLFNIDVTPELYKE